MISLAFWLIWLVALIGVSTVASKSCLLTPQFGFTVCFIPQALIAFFYVDRWDLNLSTLTLVVLITGVTLFTAVSLAVGKIRVSRLRDILASMGGEATPSSECAVKPIEIELWKILIIVGIQVLCLGLLVRYLNSLPGDSLSDKISFYDYNNKFVEDGLQNLGLAMPRYISYGRTLSVAIGYITGYLLVHSLIVRYRSHRILLGLSVVLSILATMATGGRMGSVALIISIVVMAYFIYIKSYNTFKIPGHIIAIACVIGVVLISSFYGVGLLLGRTINRGVLDYLALYLSAPLENLDLFVREGVFGSPVSNWQTLKGPINTIGVHLGIVELTPFDDLPYNVINGYNLGNVYTEFYSFLHDGGFFALLIFVTAMALISQIAFKAAMRKRDNAKIDLSVIIYSYIFYTLLFAFFGDRFYQDIISMEFVKMFICWVVVSYFLQKVYIRQPLHMYSTLVTKESGACVMPYSSIQ